MAKPVGRKVVALGAEDWRCGRMRAPSAARRSSRPIAAIALGRLGVAARVSNLLITLVLLAGESNFTRP
jgi:hypothetical protein